jgi:hypothetical protein
LEDLGAVEALKSIGSAPYNFVHLFLKSKGKYLFHEFTNKIKSDKGKSLIERPYNPVGSPYGFTEADWIFTTMRRENRDTLYVIFGLQYESKYYQAEKLIENIKSHFKDSISIYEKRYTEKVTLEFEKLEAEYGGHVFNSIASKIIGSDIAVFEASDLNPNVMIELGVALTWGISVLPLRDKTSPDLPSDISGQTWVKYESSGDKILDSNFSKKLDTMIERAIRKKGKK